MAALKLMNGLSRLSEAEAAARLEHLQAYLAWSGMPLGTQAALPFEQPDQDAIYAHDLWLAKREGREAVEAGGPLEANPYQPASDHWTAWEAGWRSSKPIPLVVKAAAPAARRKTARGRPKGSRNKPKADRMLSRLRRAEKLPEAQTARFDF